MRLTRAGAVIISRELSNCKVEEGTNSKTTRERSRSQRIKAVMTHLARIVLGGNRLVPRTFVSIKKGLGKSDKTDNPVEGSALRS